MKRTVKLTTITPKEAERLLKFNNFVGQRNIREQHCLQLAEKMDSGLFHVGNVALVHKGETTLLADGQHQLTACVLAGVPFKAVLQEYTLDDSDGEQAMARIFSQFNIDRSRNKGDIAWIYACELGWSNWNRRVVTVTAAALGMVQNGEMRYDSKLTKDQSAELLTQNIKVCEWINDMNVGSARHLRKASTVAAMISTYRKAQKPSTEFWTGVRDGTELKKNCPRYVLREWLLKTALRVRPIAGGGDKEITDIRAMYAKSIHAWNAWRQDRQTQLKYHPKSPLPKPV